jgi:RNA polymerase sigma-70 factor (ECF subfamily)
VAAAQRGDRRALEDLLRRHYDRLHAVCRRLAGNDADGADATQEALIAVVRGLGRFDGTSKFSTWAYRVAVNATLDELRRRARRQAAPLDDLPASAAAVAGPDVAQRADVDAALLKLPVEFRAAVALRDLTGLDYAEIAEVLGIPPGTVRSRIARGRAMLLPLLAPGNPGRQADRPIEQQ